MRISKLKATLMLTISALLVACGGGEDLSKKSAKELYQSAFSQLYADNSQFNFSSKAKIFTNVENPFTDNLELVITGAVDNKTGRYEIIPQVDAGIIKVNLPILLDVKKKELIVNPGDIVDTVGMFAPEVGAKLAKYKGKHVRLQLANFDIDAGDLEKATLIFTETLSISKGALDEFNQNIAQESIKKLELDSKGKEIGAKVKLRIDLDAAQSKELQLKVNAYFVDQVNKNKNFPEEFKQGFTEAMAEIDVNDNGMENSSSVMYLNDKGQLIHSQDTYNFIVDEQSVSIQMNTDYSNHGKVNFTVAPKAGDIIDITKQDIEEMQGY